MTQKVLTHEGHEKLIAEVKMLKEEKLPDIIEKLEKAKELGDLSENAEYHDAKDQQGMTVARINEIETILKSAVITEQSTSKDYISLGSTFVAENDKGVKKEFTIVGYNEADPITGKISNESPMGEAFMGKRVNDQVPVEIPRGTIVYKVIEIK